MKFEFSKQILTADNLENWDYCQYDSLKAAIESIDCGYGLKLEEFQHARDTL